MTMPELMQGMSVQNQQKIRALNAFVEYFTSAEGQAELEELFIMAADRLPAIVDYIGWQDKGNGVIEMQHSFSSLLTILNHFIANELMDSSMIAWLNESLLNGLWQEYAAAMVGRYSWYTSLPLGFVAYFYLMQMPMNVYSSYLPEEPVIIRLYRDDDPAGADGRDKAVVLFGGDAGHGLEPVGVVGRALFDGPGLHGLGDLVSDRQGQLGAGVDAAAPGVKNAGSQAGSHDALAEYVTAEDGRNGSGFVHGVTSF